jgi:hypothetical protein
MSSGRDRAIEAELAGIDAVYFDENLNSLETVEKLLALEPDAEASAATGASAHRPQRCGACADLPTPRRPAWRIAGRTPPLCTDPWFNLVRASLPPSGGKERVAAAAGQG